MKILTLSMVMLMSCQAESHNMTGEAQAQNEVQLTRAKRSNSQAATESPLSPLTADEQPFCEILDSTKLNLGIGSIDWDRYIFDQHPVFYKGYVV